MNKQRNKKIALVLIIIAITVIFRLVSNEMQWYHMVPVAALGLFSGAILKNKIWAYLIPFGAMFITDIFFELFTDTDGFYSFAQVFNYAAMLLVTLFGTKLNPTKGMKVLGFTLGGSLIFFIVSNFGVWAEGAWYPKTITGLVDCFAMALPFYKSELATKLFANSFGADMIFSIIAFGIYNYTSIAKGKLQPIKVVAQDKQA